MSESSIPNVSQEISEEPSLTEPLARRFHRDAAGGIIAHPILALVLAYFVGDYLSVTQRLEVVILVLAGVLARLLLQRAAARHRDDPARLASLTRHSTSLLAAAWGVAVVLIIPVAPPGVDGRLLMLMAGLVAGGLTTHQADSRGFQRFTGLLLGPALLGVAFDRDSLLALDLLLLAIFWAVIVALHRRTHAELRQGIASNLKLQSAIGRATREQDFVSAIFAGAPDGMAVFDPDDYLARSSLEFQRLVGQEAEERAANDPDSLRTHPFWSDLRSVTDRARVAGRAAAEVTVETDQGRRHFEVAAAAGQGAATGWVVVLIEDLTPMREAETARRQAEASYEDLVQTAHDLIWKTDLSGRWTFLNAAAGDIYGQSPVDLLGNPAFDQNHPDRWKSDVAAFEGVLSGDDLVNHETVIVHPSGAERVVSFSGRAMRDEEGAIVGAQGVARDVTERKRAEEQAREMALEAARATQMKSAFLANMSHEIRTPMNGVLGMTDLLLDTELTAEQRQFLEVIQSSGTNLLRLLNDILDVSKIEAGHLELESVPFSLERALRESVQVLEPVAEKRGNRLTLAWDPALPTHILGDSTRLRQIITNLVSNASKFTENGAVTVRARALEAGKRLRLEVEDTGVGIPGDKLEAVFGEFAQADTSVTRKFGGTGLGLTICRRLVELMGGFISVTSQVGAGSTFFFEIPVEAAENVAVEDTPSRASPASVRTTAAQPVQGPSENGTSPAAGPAPGPVAASNPAASAEARSDAVGRHAPPVLLAEDTAVNQQVAMAMLRRGGYPVELVENGAEAVAAVESGAYAFVLMDIQMPIMDGLEATRAIREMEAGTDRHIPIVALTAHALDEERDRCFQAGMDDFLSKPFKPAELLAVVERWYEAGLRGASAGAPEATSGVEPDGAPLEAAGTTGAEPPETGPVAAGTTGAEPPESGPVAAVPAAPAESAVEVDPVDSLAATLAAPESVAREAPADPDRDAPLDLEGFRESMREAGIEEVVETMLDLFVNELPERLEAIRTADADGAMKELASAAHALKSSAGNVRAQALYEGVRELERAARADDSAAASEITRRVLREGERVEAYLGALR